MSNGQPEQVAVFFDFENLAIGARRDMPSLGQEAVSAPALKLLCQQRGSATIRRAYADWGQPQFAPYQEALALNGIDLIQVKRFGAQQKNAADIRMAVDAMEALITHPEISTYILVAGDGDYSPLVQRLREYGKTVIGVGTEASASPRLVAVCSEYNYWGTLVAEANPAVRQSVQAECDNHRCHRRAARGTRCHGRHHCGRLDRRRPAEEPDAQHLLGIRQRQLRREDLLRLPHLAPRRSQGRDEAS